MIPEILHFALFDYETTFSLFNGMELDFHNLRVWPQFNFWNFMGIFGGLIDLM